MTPLQRIAMGLVLVVVDALFAGYDGVPDPLGWGLVLAGLLPLRDRLSTPGLVATAVLSLLVSLATYPPQVATRLDDASGWWLSLPQLAFAFLLCAALAQVLAGPEPDLAKRFRLLRWLVLVVAAAPVLVLGGGVEVLREPLAFLVVAVQVYLVYLLFRSSGFVTATRGSGGQERTFT